MMILCGIDGRPMRLSPPTAVGHSQEKPGGAGISFGETRANAAGDQGSGPAQGFDALVRARSIAALILPLLSEASLLVVIAPISGS
jgi:hypothetical protein